MPHIDPQSVLISQLLRSVPVRPSSVSTTNELCKTSFVFFQPSVLRMHGLTHVIITHHPPLLPGMAQTSRSEFGMIPTVEEEIQSILLLGAHIKCFLSARITLLTVGSSLTGSIEPYTPLSASTGVIVMVLVNRKGISRPSVRTSWSKPVQTRIAMLCSRALAIYCNLQQAQQG